MSNLVWAGNIATELAVRDKTIAELEVEVEQWRRKHERDVAEEETANDALRARVAELKKELSRAKEDAAFPYADPWVALNKINAIRNSIVGLQTVNVSEHIYPLVAALDEAGMVGEPYPVARANMGTLLERTNLAEAEIARLREALTEALGLLQCDIALPGPSATPECMHINTCPVCTVAERVRAALAPPAAAQVKTTSVNPRRQP